MSVYFENVDNNNVKNIIVGLIDLDEVATVILRTSDINQIELDLEFTSEKKSESDPEIMSTNEKLNTNINITTTQTKIILCA